MREMKDSGVEWIGEIPKNWKVVRGKYVLQLLDRAVDEDSDVITCFRDGEVTLRTKRREEGFTFSLKEIGYQGIRKGDLVIHGMDGFAGAIGVSDSDGKGSPVLVVCDSNENKEYISYFLRALAYMDVFLSLSTGIRERSCELGWKKISDLLFVIPPREEQDRIAHLINDRCAQIDRAIARQQEVIEKLKEYKLSVITEAVTKGLNPDVPMKDSGIEWIGEIPEHWTIGTVGNGTTKIGSGKTPRGGSEVYIDEGILFIRSQNVYETGLQLEDAVYISEEIDNEMSNTRVIKDDVLLNITGGSIGRACIYPFADKKANVNQHVCIIRTDTGIALPKYMLYLWNSYIGKTAIDLNQTGANREGMNFKQIAQTAIPFLPIQEQEEIVCFLEKRCKEIEEVISRKLSLIYKLTEYKKSLIYEVVTGKREV